MVLALIYPDAGRGAWPGKGTGGTLDSAGMAPGRYYAATGDGSTELAPGLVGFRANRDNTNCVINDYAVHCAVKAVQTRLGITADGIWGKDTSAAVARWQGANQLTADGVYGPATSKAMWMPVVYAEARKIDAAHPDLYDMLLGHIGWESGWDPGAVGGTTPQDLGLGQINGPSHPDMTVEMRLDPQAAIPWMAAFVDANLRSMNYNVRDAIAAYNLGVGGANSWVRAGRPDVWVRTVNGKSISTNVKKYIDSVLNAR